MKNTYDVIIIGAGPAGMFTAINIPKSKKVLLLETKDFPGRKLLMAGSGRCNLTHTGERNEFPNYYGDNGNFLKTALGKFSNHDLIRYMNERGLNTTIDKNGKVFPSTQKARDVLDILLRDMLQQGVHTHYNEPVKKVEYVENSTFPFSLYTQDKRNNRDNTYKSQALVIATGGRSYPTTGSTGDGYNFAKELGHNIIPTKPALTPVRIKKYKFSTISGVSLPQRTIYLYRADKKIKENRGDIGFTHDGLSGPAILDFSRYFEKNDILKLNIVDQTPQEFSQTFISKTETDGRTSVKNFLKTYEIPESLIKILLEQLTIDPAEKLAKIGRNLRLKLAEYVCEYPFTIESFGGFDIAMVTHGGVDTKEIYPKKMESRLIKNLFFAGEVIDIDGNTGGYNIQAAFSTGYLAAMNIINNFNEK